MIQPYTSGYIPHRTESRVLKGICTPTFTAALLTIAKTREQHKCPSTDECVTKRGVYIKGNAIQCKKEGNSATCYNMNKPSTSRWEKPASQSQKDTSPTILILGMATISHRQWSGGCQGLGAEGRELAVNGFIFSFTRWKGMGWTAVNFMCISAGYKFL